MPPDSSFFLKWLLAAAGKWVSEVLFHIHFKWTSLSNLHPGTVGRCQSGDTLSVGAPLSPNHHHQTCSKEILISIRAVTFGVPRAGTGTCAFLPGAGAGLFHRSWSRSRDTPSALEPEPSQVFPVSIQPECPTSTHMVRRTRLSFRSRRVLSYYSQPWA